MKKIEELRNFFIPEKKEIKADNRKLKLLGGKPNEIPTVKEYESVEVIGTFYRNGESAICARIDGMFCPLILTSKEYDGVLCAEYKTFNGFLAWCNRQIG